MNPLMLISNIGLDASELGLALSSKVIFLNDFHAVGLGLPHIPQAELHTLYAPPPSVGGGGGGGAAPAELEPGVIGCLGPGQCVLRSMTLTCL